MRTIIARSLYVFIAGLIVILAAAANVFPQNREEVSPSPKLEIASLQHDFGQVVPGMALKYTFQIRNLGTADLVIKSVVPGCGCTTSDFDKVIAPGHEGKITLAIAVTDHLEGHLSKQAIVQTNDPAHASFALSLLADFKKRDTGGLSILPSDQWTINVAKGSTASTTIKILNGRDVPVYVTKVDAGGKSFNVSLVTNEYGSSYSVTIEIPKSLAIGHYSQVATVYTSSPVMPQIPIRLEANVTPELSITPVALKLTDISAIGDPQKAECQYLRLQRQTAILKLNTLLQIFLSSGSRSPSGKSARLTTSIWFWIKWR